MAGPFSEVNPGSGVSETITQILAERRLRARQDMLDQLELRKQNFNERLHTDQLAELSRQHDIQRAENMAKGLTGRTGQEIPQESADALSKEGFGYMLNTPHVASPIPQVGLTGETLPPTDPNAAPVEALGQAPPTAPLGTTPTGVADTMPKTKNVVAPSATELARQKFAGAIKGITDPKEIARLALESPDAIPPGDLDNIIKALQPPNSSGTTPAMQKDTVLYKGKPTDVLVDVHTGKTFLQTPDGLLDVTGHTDHYRPEPVSSGDTHQLVPELDTKGAPTGRYFAYDSKHPGFSVVPGPAPIATKAPPGASTIAAQGANKQTGLVAINRLDQDIADADKAGLLGPAAGRWYEALAKLGTTGDPVKDDLIGRIKGDLLLAKMHVDAGIGGTRAAASPLLLQRWDDLAIKSSSDLLKGYTRAIRDDMTAGQAPAAGAAGGAAQNADDLRKKYNY